ncbi:MAG: hypothetical protein M1823_002172 [Watsoniomyces obsoletus]|nr:MAG: hypothetical protein M1823_002172 [Watsoniomyces obsoletus]
MASPGTPGSWQADFPPYSPLTLIVDPSVLPSIERAETPVVLPATMLFQRQLSLRPQDRLRETATLVPDKPGTQQDPLDVDAPPSLGISGPSGRGNTAGISSLQRPAVQRHRVRLTDEERVELVRICVSHAQSYQPGKVTLFWAVVSSIFSQKTGKRFKEPRQLVNRLVSERKLQLKIQETQSGVLQEATELSNALDLCMVVVKDFDDIQINRRQNQEEAERQREDTQRQTEELLVSVGRRKRVWTRDDESEQGNDGDPDGYSTPATQPSHRSDSATRRRPRRQCNPSASRNSRDSAFGEMATAMGQLATTMARMATTEVVENEVVKRLESLEDSVKEIKDAADRKDEADDRRHQELLAAVGLRCEDWGILEGLGQCADVGSPSG